MDRKTRQGVRDLDHLPARQKGSTLPEPPVPVACRHRDRREVQSLSVTYVICQDCNRTVGEY